MKLMPENEVNEAALNDTKSIDRIDGFKAGVAFAESKLRELAIEFLDSIKEYERENGQRICFDERDSKELFEIFIKERNKKE